MVGKLTVSSFPEPRRSVRARWAPIYLSPILGSPERFVIAVAAADDSSFHIETANELKRLKCLYGEAAETALFAAEVALEELNESLASEGSKTLLEGAFIFSGVSIGAVSDGEASSIQSLGKLWMAAMSSLYRYVPDVHDVRTARADDHSADRLPILVLNHVIDIDPSLEKFFDEDIRQHKRRRSPAGITNVSIDYNGPHLVANFATLQVGSQAQNIDRIKRKMFDLRARRDNEREGLFGARHHEMMIFAPSASSYRESDKKNERLDDALADLAEQSRSGGFNLHAFHDVPDICQRLVEVESHAV